MKAEVSEPTICDEERSDEGATGVLMAITRGNLPAHELIGLEVEVARSTDRKMVGMKGKVVDETRNTLVVESGGREKVLPKAACVFRFTLPGGEKAEAEGRMLAVAPEDRPKKLMKYCR